MKKSTISRLKSIFGSKKGKKHHQKQQSSKSSRSVSPEPAGDASPCNDDFRPFIRTPPPTRAGPPPSPPVPTHPKAPVAPEPSGPQSLVPCLVCGRTFLPPSLAKHIKICEKMTVKKRKTFDSSRQRREGTELEQYLPKNFGLPENSPFLEKSPPPTAKPKPKAHPVRNAITKPMADLQKCPHCSRNFGVRAFERHVEWCADKAKILPAAPVQPPQHIADAKQRLNARTQYKAPPVRGRRSSQTRDKSSNSRSASVESTRGVSPPREYGDYRHGRTRTSESVSSNDCHEETSHVPLIKNTRNSQSNSSGDANVKARQARLARDLSSTSAAQDPDPSLLQQSNTNPKINKTEPLKQKKRLNVKKQQQLKKLEEIATKYNERAKEKLEESKPTAGTAKREKSLIPIPKKININNSSEEILDEDGLETVELPKVEETKPQISKNSKSKTSENLVDKNLSASNEPPENSKIRRSNTLKNRVPISRREAPAKNNKTEMPEKDKKKRKEKETKKIVKETSMSLDSLEDISLDSSRNCQSIGINTELLCVPCVIHETTEPKSSRKSKTKPVIVSNEVEPEPSVELLYQNPVMVNTCDTRIRETFESTDSKEYLSVSNSKHSLITFSNSGNFTSDNVESTSNISQTFKSKQSQPSTESLKKIVITEIKQDDVKSEKDYKSEDTDDLSAENFEDNNELDVSNELCDSIEAKSEEPMTEEPSNEIECRYGSCETYTKFTENPDDLEEFMNLTDKLMTKDNDDEIEQDISNLHTPKTSSLETINKDSLEEDQLEDTNNKKYNFSDTFEDLKSDFKELVECAGDNVVLEKTKANDAAEEDASKNVSDMEHITVYELKIFEKKALSEKKLQSKESQQFKLPSIEETNKPETKVACNKKRMQKIYKPNRKYKLLGEKNRSSEDYKTFIVNSEDNSDGQSITSEAPPLKLPRIETKKRLDENYDPFASAARQMKELMSTDSNMSKKNSHSSKDLSRTLPILRPNKEKSSTMSYNSNNTKMMKDTLNKSYQKTPTLQRMKSFGSTNNDNNNSFGGRCSSFRVRNDKQKSNQKLNTTFTKSSKENISTLDNKSYFNRNSNLNRSFSSYTASSYSTPKPKDKIPKIATSMYHSFQRTTIKQPVKLDKIKRDDEKKDFVSLDAILVNDNSSMTDSNYIDPRLINENDNLPINVNTILNNPDIISSMESLLTTENLPAKFESFSSSNLNNNIKNRNGFIDSNHKLNKLENNNIHNNKVAPVTNLSTQYDKIMCSLEQSLTSKTSIRDDESLCEDFDLEEFMTTFDEEIVKQKTENKRTCSSTTRVVKQSELIDSNRSSEFNSVSSTPKTMNGMNPVNKSMSLTFSSNNTVNENLFPSCVKRSTSLLDSIQKKSTQKVESTKQRHKVDQLEQDLMQSLKDFDKMYASEKDHHSSKESIKCNGITRNGTARRDSRAKPERKLKKDDATNGNYTPSGKASNDSAYSSLNRISPSKLSLCTSKEPNGLPSLDAAPVISDSSSHKDDARSVSSEEFLAMERSAELEEPLPQPDIHPPFKEMESLPIKEKRVSSRASSRRSPTWRGHGELSSSSSEASLHPGRRDSAPAPRLSRFCHECGTRFSVETAKFCIECGIKRLVV